MAIVYPIVLKKYSDGYLVTIPDFDINTEGSDLADAIYMARDAIGIMGIQYQDMSKPLPEPFSQRIVIGEGETNTLVDVDFEDYRKKHDQQYTAGKAQLLSGYRHYEVRLRLGYEISVFPLDMF